MKKDQQMYYIYMIRCKDNSIYTGITTDLNRRVKEHINKEKKCAKYTYFHTATKLEMAWCSSNRKLASKLEYWLKTLPKFKKEELIENPCNLEKFLDNKIDCSQYKVNKESEDLSSNIQNSTMR